MPTSGDQVTNAGTDVARKRGEDGSRAESAEKSDLARRSAEITEKKWRHPPSFDFTCHLGEGGRVAPSSLCALCGLCARSDFSALSARDCTELAVDIGV